MRPSRRYHRSPPFQAEGRLAGRVQRRGQVVETVGPLLALERGVGALEALEPAAHGRVAAHHLTDQHAPGMGREPLRRRRARRRGSGGCRSATRPPRSSWPMPLSREVLPRAAVDVEQRRALGLEPGLVLAAGLRARDRHALDRLTRERELFLGRSLDRLHEAPGRAGRVEVGVATLLDRIHQAALDRARCGAALQGAQDGDDLVHLGLFQGAPHGVAAQRLVFGVVGDVPVRRQTQLEREQPRQVQEESVQRAHAEALDVAREARQEPPQLAAIELAPGRFRQHTALLGVAGRLDQAPQDALEDLARGLAREGRGQDAARSTPASRSSRKRPESCQVLPVPAEARISRCAFTPPPPRRRRRRSGPRRAPRAGSARTAAAGPGPRTLPRRTARTTSRAQSSAASRSAAVHFSAKAKRMCFSSLPSIPGVPEARLAVHAQRARQPAVQRQLQVDPLPPAAVGFLGGPRQLAGLVVDDRPAALGVQVDAVDLGRGSRPACRRPRSRPSPRAVSIRRARCASPGGGVRPAAAANRPRRYSSCSACSRTAGSGAAPSRARARARGGPRGSARSARPRRSRSGRSPRRPAASGGSGSRTAAGSSSRARSSSVSRRST